MSERERLKLHLAVDLAILTVRENQLQVLVVVRGNVPFQGQEALPGGFLRKGEDLVTAAERELWEETRLGGDDLHLEQLYAYGEPDRDPRYRVVSVAYVAFAPDLPLPQAGSDARSSRWAPDEEEKDSLAFDHNRILADAVERARSRLETSTLATAFCQPAFTIGELRNVYEVVWGVELDPRNFSRKVLNTDGFIEPTGDKRAPETGRPAALYRKGKAVALNPPIMRSGD